MKKEKINIKETKEFKELYKNISNIIRKSGIYPKRKRKTVKDERKRNKASFKK